MIRPNKLEEGQAWKGIKWVTRRYLPFAPFAVVPLLALYHLDNVWAGLIAGSATLAITILALWASPRLTYGSPRAAGALLVLGGAVVWMVGPSGPPDPANLAVLVYNQTGLTLGFLMILLGAFAIAALSLRPISRKIAAVGASTVALGFIAWTLQSALGITMLLISSYGSLRALRETLAYTSEPLIYIGVAGLVYALRRSGLVGGRAALAMIVFSLAEAPLSGLLPRMSYFGVAAAGLFGIPALMAIVPYYVGLSLLASSGTKQISIQDPCPISAANSRLCSWERG